MGVYAQYSYADKEVSPLARPLVALGHDLLRLCLQRIASPLGDPMHHDLSEFKNAGDSTAASSRLFLAPGHKQILQPKVLDLVKIVMRMENMLLRLIGEHIGLHIRCDPDLKKIKADPGQIEQVIMNLTINARDAMPWGKRSCSGGRLGNITVRLENVALDNQASAALGDLQAGDYVMLSVSDTGVGMDEETVSQIFGLFYITKEVEKGSSTRLSTVFGIVKQSGGEVGVESEPGKGTTFRIYLPQVKAPTLQKKASLLPHRRQ